MSPIFFNRSIIYIKNFIITIILYSIKDINNIKCGQFCYNDYNINNLCFLNINVSNICCATNDCNIACNDVCEELIHYYDILYLGSGLLIIILLTCCLYKTIITKNIEYLEIN